MIKEADWKARTEWAYIVWSQIFQLKFLFINSPTESAKFACTLTSCAYTAACNLPWSDQCVESNP